MFSAASHQMQSQVILKQVINLNTDWFRDFLNPELHGNAGLIPLSKPQEGHLTMTQTPQTAYDYNPEIQHYIFRSRYPDISHYLA